jgi:hypothetical protein
MSIEWRQRLVRPALIAYLVALCAAPTIATAAPRPSGLCMNYGHDSYVHDLSPDGTVAQDFRRLKSADVMCIRIAYRSFNDVQTEALAQFAVARGFYVISGGEWGMLDSAQLPQYRAQVLTQAKWAEANGIAQFSVGNEQEARLSGISFSRWVNEMVALAADVRAFFSGTVSYEAGGTFADDWATVNVGSLDLLGLNTYGGYAHNAHSLQENIAAHGMSHVYLSETNCDVFNVELCKTDEGLATEMKGDLLKLIAEYPQTAFYLYTWRAGGTDFAAGVVNYPKTLAALGIK